MFTRKPHQPATLERAARLTAALLLSLSSVAPAIRPVAMSAIAGVATVAAVAFHPPLLDPLLGAPKSAFAYDPNLPPNANQADYCYGLNDNAATVSVVDRFTGAFAYSDTVTGLSGGTNEGSSFDSSTGIFYVLDQKARPDRLVQVNLTVGGASSVTEVGTGGLLTVSNPATLAFGVVGGGNEDSGDNRLTGITISPFDGQMFGVTNEAYLFKINKTTGKVVLGGMSGGVDYVQIPMASIAASLEPEDMAFDPVTGNLYIVFENPRDGTSPGNGFIHRINPTTGALIGSPLGPIGRAGDGSPGKPGPGGQAETEGLTFGGDGTMYVSLGDSGVAANDGKIIRILQPINDTTVENGEILTTLPFGVDLLGGSSNYDYESMSCNAGAPVILSLNKTHSPQGRLVLGQQVTFTILVSNTGSFTSSAQVVDIVPPQIAVSAWTCSTSPVGVCTPASGTTNAVAVSAFIPPISGTLRLLITGTVASGLQPVITNTATVTETVYPEIPFGNTDPDPVELALDFGDAAGTNYPTLATENGAQHVISPTFHMGALIDADLGTLENGIATADDANNLDDEDGVTFGALARGANGTVDIVVAGGSGFINLWIDLNGAGDWSDPGEQLLTNQAVVAGVNNLNVLIPNGATAGLTSARVRLTSATVASPSPAGLLPDGEVEDYQVTILDAATNTPTATPTATSVPPTNTPTATPTATGVPPTDTPTPTNSPTNTPTPTNTATNTPTPTSTPTSTPIPLNSSIGGLVYVDTFAQNDGTYNVGEPPVAGVLITLTGVTVGGAPVLVTTNTDASGYYTFTGLAPGIYTVTEQQPSQWVDDLDTVGNSLGTLGNDVIGGIDLQPNSQATGYNFGEQGVVIGDLAWADLNGNGQQDGGGETGISGVQVTLVTQGGAPANTATDGSGTYTYTDVPINTAFTLTFGLPAGYARTAQDTGPDGTDSDPAPATGIATMPDGVTADTLTFDAGYFQPASIGGIVYVDQTATDNGAYDNDEPLVAGVLITLTGFSPVSGTFTLTTLTGLNGQYLFSNLPPGTYTVTEQQPPQWRNDLDTVGSSGGTLNDDVISGITLASGATATGYNFGEQGVALGDLVWSDLNANGIQDGGAEVGLPGVTVTLHTPAGIFNTQTNASGLYSFTDMPVGTVITLTFSTLPGYVRSPQDQTGDAQDSDPNAATGVVTTTLPVVDETMFFQDYDQGLFQLLSLGDRAWNDLNANGQQDPGEPGIPGVTVTLQTPAGLLSTQTDANGIYTFTGLIPNTPYTVTFTPAGGYNGTPQNFGPDASDSDPGAANGQAFVTLTQTDVTVDAGFWLPASLTGTVWVDFDNNGTQNPGEPVVPGTTITLVGTTPTGTVTYVTTTGPDGTYSFPSVPPGVYTVTEQQPPQWLDNTDYPGNQNGNTSPPDSIINVVLQSGTNATGNNFSEQGVDLGDRVWNDLNANGQQDPGEPGIPGVTVTLQTPAGLLTTQTDVNGIYTFTHLQINTPYTVTFTPMGGYNGTPQNIGNDASDSDPSAANGQAFVTLTQTDVTVDAGFWRPASLTGTVWVDFDNNGTQNLGEPVVPSATITLVGTTPTGTVTYVTTTGPDGTYSFPSVPPGVYTVTEQQPPQWLDNTDYPGNAGGSAAPPDSIINVVLQGGANATNYNFTEMGVMLGDRVWEDLNHNGQQDPGEPGIPGVTVTLQTPTGLLTTQTNLNGIYTFTNQPVNTPLSLTFSTPMYYTSTLTNVGPAATDSDPNPFTGLLPVNVTTNTNTFDAGFWRPMTFGNQVWFDLNNNGVVDGGEGAANGVVVELYRDTNGDGSFTPGIDALVSSTTTSNGGYYSFTELPAGGYLAVITATNFAGAGVLVNYQNSGPTVTGNSDQDGRDHGNVAGVLGAGGYVASTVVTLTAGTEPNQVVGPGDANFTIDFGFYQLILGNAIWNDINNNGRQDAGEPGMPGVPVTLTAPGGAIIATTTSDASGRYTFTQLTPGDYIVSIGAPTGLVSSASDGGDPDNNVNGDDNGIGNAGGEISSGVITLVAGAEITNTTSTGTTVNDALDFGIYRPYSLGNRVWEDLNNNGLIDPDEQDNGLEGWEVQLYDTASGAFLGNRFTDNNGFYRFDNLGAGTFTVTVIPRLGYVNSTGQSGSLSGPYETAPDPDITVVDEDDNGTYNLARTRVETVVTIGDAAGGDTEPVAEDTEDGPSDTLHPDGRGDMTVDFGFFQPLSLGSRVWYDNNNDGKDQDGTNSLIADGSSTGVPGVAMELYYDTNGNGVFDPLFDTYVSRTMTIVGGYYTFTNLGEGDYLIVITSTNFVAGGALAGYRSSDPLGVNDTIAPVGEIEPQNLDDSGTETLAAPLQVLYVATTQILLRRNQEPINDGDSNSNTNFNIDFGFYRLMLGDSLWRDDNDNGRQDPGEPPMAGIVMTLTDAAGTVLSTTLSDASGLYTFTGLLSGTYYVQATVPYGYRNSTDIPSTANPENNIGNDDNGIGDTRGVNVVTSGPVVMIPREFGVLGNNRVTTSTATTHDPTIDFGLVPLMAIGNQVWYDVNDNGILDAGEQQIAGVAVELYRDTNGNGRLDFVVDVLTRTILTTADGYYTFTELISGTYFVVITSSNFALGGVLRDYRSSAPTILESNNPADKERDHGYEVGAMGSGGYVSATAVLIPPYGLVTEPVGEGGATDETVPNHLDVNTQLTMGFGFYRLYVASGMWIDRNNNGIRDAGEPTIGNLPTNTVTVTLFLNGVALMTTTTDANGLYTFTNLLSGMYQVQITMPPNYRSSDVDEAPNADSNINDNQTVLPSDNGVGGITGGPVVSSTVFNLFAGNGGVLENNIVTTGTGTTVNPTIDFGVRQPLALGDVVWFDTNNNGRYDATEAPVAGVTVTLWTTDSLGIYRAILTATTDVNGRYVFTNLIPGQYVVRIPNENFGAGGPLENARTSSDVAGITEVGDDNIGATLTGSDNGYEMGFGPLGAGAGGYVSSVPITLEEDTEPISPTQEATTGSGGRDIPPHHGDNDTNMSIGFGFYQLYVASVVWDDRNNNGIRDTGEPTMGNLPTNTVTVTLFLNGVPISMTTTDAAGLYTFTGMMSGTYIVQIEVPRDYVSSDPDEVNPNGNINDGSASVQDNGLGGITGGEVITSGPVDLTPGDAGALTNTIVTTANGTTNNPTLDFGVRQPLALGDTVWFDTNDNGLLDAGEQPVPNMVATLWTTDTSGTYRAILTATTTITGYYVFTNLTPGEYVVRLPASNFEGAGALVNYRSSDPTSGTPNDDIENDDNGIEVGVMGAGGYVSSGVITLQPDQEPVEDNNDPIAHHGDNDTNMTVEFGFYRLYVGNLVWDDFNRDGLQTPGEPGVAGMTVTLTNLRTSEVLTTVTDASGLYTFTNLLSDTYQAAIYPRKDFVSTVDTAGTPNPDDSAPTDDNGIGGIGGPLPIQTVPFKLTAGAELVVDGTTGTTNDPTIGFGIREPLSIGFTDWYDVNDNGLIDLGEGRVQGASVVLWSSDPAGNPLAPLMTATTSITGYHVFTDLKVGDYVVQLPPGNFGPGGVLQNYLPSDPVDVNPNNNNVNDNVGVAKPGLGVMSARIVLTPNVQPVGEGGIAPMHGDNDSNNTLGFGFYKQTVSNQVWVDLNQDGLYTPDEPPIVGATVVLIEQDGTPVLTATTDAAGHYTLTGVPSGTFQIKVVLPPAYDGYVPTPINGGDPDYTPGDPTDDDSDNNALTVIVGGVPLTGTLPFNAIPGLSSNNVAVNPLNGTSTNPTVDLGFIVPINNAVTLANVTAVRAEGGVRVTWRTLTELDTDFFMLMRVNGRTSSNEVPANATRVTPARIGAAGGNSTYSFVDTSASASVMYTYYLVEIETDGDSNVYGPLTVRNNTLQVFLPMLSSE